MKKFLKKFLKSFLFVIIFVAVFGVSAVSKFKAIFGGETFSAFALQGASSTVTLSEDEVTKEFVDIRYIKENGSIDTRQIVIYKPVDAKGDIPLIYVPHYAIEEDSAD